MTELAKQKSDAPCIDDRNRSNTVWAALSDEEVDLFNKKAVCRPYGRGESVFLEGEPCNGLYFVQEGVVGVRKTDRDGNSSLVRVANAGDTLGYRPFLAKQPHRAEANVIENSRICFINATTVREILQANHELGLQFLERTAEALGEAEERLFEVTVLNVGTRVIHLLVLYHDRWGSHLEDGSVNITLPITREDLAAMTGAHPDSVIRAIRQLETQGLMQVDGRMIHIEEFDLLVEQLHSDLAHYH